MNELLKFKIEKFLLFSLFVVGGLVIFSIVPNSFSISLVGFAVSLLWFGFSYRNQSFYLPQFAVNKKNFYIGFSVWLALILFAACLSAWARFVSPGYDLYWFAQSITNAKIGNGLHISSEKIIPSLLVQHWEPILFSVIPLTFLFSGAVAAVLWQALGLCGGAFGAWRVSSFIFKDSPYQNLKYFLTFFYAIGFANVNPLTFDIHPPVFGGLLFIPWIIYFILQKKKLIPFLLLLLLMQCGEMFFAIAPAYFVYLILEKKISAPRIIFSILIYASGYLLIGSYQKYFGPWWSGTSSFSFGGRYSATGGDGLGILKTFIHHPFLIISQFIVAQKIKTFLKLFVYYGFLPVIALASKKYRLLVNCLWLGSIPYFIQAGVASDLGMSETNKQYIASIGSQWWCLTVFGIYTLSEEYLDISYVKKIFQKNLIVPIFLMLFFLNSSEWRKSLIYSFRAIIERERVDTGTRNYLENLPKSEGVLLAGVEWLCPLAADDRYYTLCYVGHEEYLPVMPLQTIIASEEGLQSLYKDLSPQVKESNNAKIIYNILHYNLKQIHWEKVADKSQKNSDKRTITYSIWHILK